MNILQTDIKYVPGVGTKRAEILNKEIDAFTLGDLLRWYPYRYIDRTRIFYVHEIDSAQAYIQLKGKITAFVWWPISQTAPVSWIWYGFREYVLWRASTSLTRSISSSGSLHSSMGSGTSHTLTSIPL